MSERGLSSCETTEVKFIHVHAVYTLPCAFLFRARNGSREQYHQSHHVDYKPVETRKTKIRKLVEFEWRTRAS